MLHIITHPSPTYAGCIVALARAFHFTAGVSTAEVNDAEIAVLRMQGFTVEPGPEVTEPEPEVEPKAKRRRPARGIHDDGPITEPLPEQMA
ncbi:hypothetical protein [Gordonia sp. NPDC003376]